PKHISKIIKDIEPGVKLADTFDEDLQNDRLKLILIIVSTFILVGGMLFQEELHNIKLLLLDLDFFVFGFAYILVGYPVLLNAFYSVRKRDLFTENSLMTIATLGAFLIHELPEAVAVMLFFSVGEYLQNKSIDRSRRSIRELIDIRSETANIVIDGKIQTTKPEKINIGDTIVVKPGEKVPIDGVITSGSSYLDTSTLTGESRPRKVEPGDEILSGVVNLSSLLYVRASKRYEDSTASKILELIENSSNRKASVEKFMTKFARVYTPGVVLIAFLIAILPPILIPGE
ncbi:MAG: P-type ATPase, partial [Candidatus Hodarchaeales archaeon]